MKALPIAAIVALAGFLASGCQESPTTGPVMDAPQSVTKAADLQNNVIALHAILRDPSFAFNSFLEVNGEVAYRVNKTSLTKAGAYYDVELITDVSITPPGDEAEDGALLRAGERSSDRIRETDVIMDQGYFELSKSYSVDGRKDGLVLNIVFRVEEKSFAVSTISFSLMPKTIEDATK